MSDRSLEAVNPPLVLPVQWVEDPDSRVRVLQVAWQNLGGMLRLRRNLRRDRP